MRPLPRYAVARWTALGSYVQLLVRPERLGRGASLRAASLLADIERCCSRFRPDSDLSRANRNAGERTEIDGPLVLALRAALAAARATDGLVDPTLGLALQALGYDRDLPEVRRASQAAAVTVPSVTGSWRDVELDDRGVRVPFGRALDLGATGKAFAADLIARTLPEELGVDVLVSLGGDVAVGGEPNEDWRVAVCETPEQAEAAGQREPTDPVRGVVETIPLRAGGLATSSVVRRRWQRAGQDLHHLLDPRTGTPVRPVWRTASVIADDCVTANTASTAAVILGDRAVDWLTSRGLPARLVHANGEVVHLGDWPTTAD
ncbi:MAG: FAD:protein transferase [Actinomycetota bacterium]|nr:FAD:protein transferase [Actinomycetota bacterium]